MSNNKEGGTLTFDTTLGGGMVSIPKTKQKTIQDECSLVNLKDINWSNVDHNTWFICLNSDTNEVYYFPIYEEVNRNNNYNRVKNGMSYFISQGCEAYRINFLI